MMRPTTHTWLAGSLGAMLSFVLVAGCASDPSGGAPDLTGPDGKADGAGCPISGTFVARGTWPSFSAWTFRIADGALVHSYTDDLGEADWRTEISFGHGTGRVTLRQTTEASDMLIETVLHLRRAGCDAAGQAALEVDAAYTLSVDNADLDGDSLERHDVSLERMDE
ncbi:MAG: hypothetical protein SFX73_04595 [Kofleriaceae bacterium]|nr:hypothetical protein [Kofleriaceae bacterium]